MTTGTLVAFIATGIIVLVAIVGGISLEAGARSALAVLLAARA